MKYLDQYLNEEIHVAPLGILSYEEVDDIHETCLSGVEVIIDGKHTDIYISYADYANWIDKKYADSLDVINILREQRDEKLSV